MANQAARGALKSYLGMKNPGYAILIDAPWGSGKTHFVRNACSVGNAPKEVRYASLNGVSNESEFRRALLKESFEGSLAKNGSIFASILSRQFKLGDLGNLARDILEERLIATLPDTLIFDDIERASLDPQVLLGLLNDFVEHKGKRVVLLIHSEEQEQKGTFLKRKEKLVGRTLQIEADFDAAFPSFIEALENAPGKRYLQENRCIIKSVFEQAGHQNLRLLRNALRDCSLVLDRIDEELFAAKEPMARLVRTYIALAMALAKGEIALPDLDRRDNAEIGISSEVEVGLNSLLNRHTGADIYAHSGAVLSKALCELLFVHGHADTETLNKLLKSTNQFEPQDANPLWRRMHLWGQLGWAGLNDLVEEAKRYLFETSSVEAGPYLHIADGMLYIEEYGGLEISRQGLKQEILQQIDILAKNDGIPAAEFGRLIGWDKRGKYFSFGGYGCDANADFLEIMDAMFSAQMGIYEHKKAEKAKELVEDFENDLSDFHLKISLSHTETTYYRTPIFQEMDVNRFAKASIGYLKNGNATVLGQMFETIAERHKNNGEWREEIKWFHALREELEKHAAEHSKLARAQLEALFRHYWKFRKPEQENKISDS